jgi:hypothetical protein
VYRQLPVYSVVKILYTNSSVLTNKAYSGKKPLTATWGGNRLLLLVISINGDISNPVKEPATGRGIYLKMKTLPRISCIQ